MKLSQCFKVCKSCAMNLLNEILTSTSTLKQVSKQFYCNTVFRTTKVKSLLQIKHIENRANKVPKIKSLLQMKHIENRGNKVPKVFIIQYRLQQFF